MATKTTNYGFSKPEMNEYANVETMGAVFDEIDDALHEVEDKLDNLDIPTPDVSGQIEKHNTSETAHEGMFAPMYTYGTTDLTAGTSSLETGKIYLVYE